MQQDLKFIRQTLDDEKRQSQLNIQKNNKEYEEKLQKCLEEAEQDKREAVDKALKHAEKEWSQRERDVIQKVNAERDSLEIKAKRDYQIESSRALELEKGKVLSMEKMIEALKKVHEEEKQEMMNSVEEKNIEIQALTNEKKLAVELVSSNELHDEVEKVRMIMKYCVLLLREF
jgi:hypothetical protein